MTDDFGYWIVAGLMAWVVIGFFWLFFFWKTWKSLAEYFSEMEATPWEKRSALGWPAENPITPVLGLRRDRTRIRLFQRLAFWGAPPQLEHSAQAMRALGQYRLLWWTAMGLKCVAVLGASLILSPVFLLPVVIGLAVLLMIVKPFRWSEKL